jgi:uncharacterized protein (TIGR03066 family)
MRLFGLALAYFALTLAAAAQDQKDASTKEKLVGVWEVKEGATVEFTKDGKLKVTFRMDGKEASAEGTYALEGDKLTITHKIGDKEEKETLTVKSLDDKVLTTVDSRGRTETLKRKK